MRVVALLSMDCISEKGSKPGIPAETPLRRAVPCREVPLSGAAGGGWYPGNGVWRHGAYPGAPPWYGSGPSMTGPKTGN